ncbi:MAG: LytTR family DNA-binding domain-containing protein [Bacteroidota bacterium]|nr:response regulator transcription factor [Flavisolibacter sp.]MBD0286299.1 response regulator transcription factor [Flavisolibacter sp.]MBD0352112.1 response regulator transcription factor [Flavisolibacter sp.]MBD0364698.1 response regulator transcription factor [Flavisolibacter sp.]MDQ3845965.1 LytTR family DNA-binding domain-containing protein [Bacteroidota bacterium]
MRCLIIDDNKMARMAMKQLVAQVPTLQLVAECTDAMEAYHIINNKTVDLLLLDIEMPGMTGLELTKNLGKIKPLIVFTTAKTDYAVEAFELNVIDYLIKPITPSRFLLAIDRASEALAADKQEVKVQEQEFVFVKDNGVLKRINTDDILYLEAMGDYVKVHTPQRFHVLHSTLKAIEEKLSSQKFVRVHRSYIVSLNKIDSIQEGTILIGKASIPIADTYRTALHKKLNLL